MKFHSLSRYLAAFAFAMLVVSCGGGGGATAPQIGGPVIIEPANATLFAGVRYTITITGGRTPYTLTSTEPQLINLPSVLDGHSLDVVPNNPSVIDEGLTAENLPVRTIIVTARGADGTAGSATFKVARNFLTGYGFTFGVTTCTSIPSPCAGGDTTILFDSTFVGNLQPNHTYRIERVRGPFQFLDPVGSNNQSDSILVTSDSTGRFTAVIRVASGAPTQLAMFRVTDVASGATSLHTFVINGVVPGAPAPLVLIPATQTLTGPDGTTCGYGVFDVLVFDGVAPYTAICPNPQLLVRPPSSSDQPGRFTFVVAPSNTCLTAEPCVIIDARGTRATVQITTVKGVTTPPTPPAPIVATPSSITLACGTSGNVTVTGGQGSFAANSTHPRVTATVSGNSVTITRLSGDTTPPAPFPTTGTVSVTDGSTSTPIAVNLTQATCP